MLLQGILGIIFGVGCVAGRFFVMSDLHYDILYGAQYNSTYQCHDRNTTSSKIPRVATGDVQPVVRPGCDSSLLLIAKALEKMQEVDPEPEFILVLGDVIGHYTSSYLTASNTYDPVYNIELIKKSHQQVAETLFSYFPNTQIIPMIGNNDAYADYEMPEGQSKKEYLEFLYKLWTPLVKDLPEIFLEYGFYNTTTKTGTTILALNTLILSFNQHELNVGQKQQFQWLESQLQLNTYIFIVLHISPGFCIHNGGLQLWNDLYTHEFKHILSKYPNKVQAVLAGHLHDGVFELIGDIPVLMNPSITPLFGGNPGFRYYDWASENYEDYVLDSYNFTGVWQSTSFETEYGHKLDLVRLLLEIQTGLVSIPHFVEIASGWWIYENPPFLPMCKPIFGSICNGTVEVMRRVAVCAIRFQSAFDFEVCKKVE